MNRFIPLILFLALCTALGLTLVVAKPDQPNALLGKPFPNFETAALDGGTINNASFQGKPAIINIFASWCVPCLAEHPELIATSKQFPGVAIIGIGWMDKPENIAKMLKEHGSPYTAVGIDTPGRLTAPLGITGVPETYIVDQNGITRAKFVSPITVKMLEKELAPLTAKY